MTPFTIPLFALVLWVPLPEPAPARTAAPTSVKQSPQADLMVEAVRARLPRSTDDAQRTALVAIVTALRAGDTALAAKRWSSFVSDLRARGGEVDPSAHLMWVLRQSCIETNDGLRAHADKVRFLKDQIREVRRYIVRLQAHLGSLAEGAVVVIATIELSSYQLFAAPVRAGGDKRFDKTALEAEIARWEHRLDALTSELDPALFDLQKQMEDAASVVQTLTSIQKTLSDTAKAILQNMKA